ncbi:MAG: hypothetical protein ACFFB7_07605, partial [Candidatus Sifarchaeia archaeon]
SHFLYLQGEVTFENQNNNLQPLVLTSNLVFKIDHNKIVAFKEDFNSGLLTDWSLSTTGSSWEVLLTGRKCPTGILEANFDSYSLRDWTTVATGGEVTVEDGETYSPSPALKVSMTEFTGEAYASKLLKHQSGYFEMCFVMKTDSTCGGSKYGSVIVKQGSTDRIEIAFNSGCLKYRDNTGWHTIYEDYFLDNFYNIRLKVWPQFGNYSIDTYYHGFVPNVGMLGSGSGIYLDTVQVQAKGKGATLWVDGISVTRDSSLYLKYPDYLNKVRLTESVTGVDRTKDYTVSLNYFTDVFYGSQHMVVYDDGKVEIVNRINPSNGYSTLYANTPGGLVEIFPLVNKDIWHRIVIKAHPSTSNYYVLVDEVFGDDGGRGPYAMKSGTPSGYSFSIGSKITPLSGESGRAYWDDIVIAVPYPST